MQVVIALFLTAIGVAMLLGGYRLYRRIMARAAELAEVQIQPPLEMVPSSEEVHADGLVYLFGHEFVAPKTPRPMTLPRDRAFAPISEQELDPEDWALQILYAVFCELHVSGCVEFRIVERSPSLLPPFPHKRWELQICQRRPFPASPVMDALGVAVDLMRSRKQQRVAQGKEMPGELWCPLDEVIERALKAMRQEITFWERSGVYGDLRNYVASALVAQGHLIQPSREAWIDRSRSRRIKPHPASVERLAPEAKSLQKGLKQFRLKHGSPYAQGLLTQEPEERQPLPDVDPALLSADPDPEHMPLDDCLRISIYETLVCLRQLEPSGDAGI